MNLETAIIYRRLIDVNMFDGRIIYTGICVYASKQIITMINLNEKTQKFDGFTIFRNDDFDSYEIYKKKFSKIQNDNSEDFFKKFKFDNLKTYYAWFKKLTNNYLVAFFTKPKLTEYIVGRIIFVDRDNVKLQLIDKDGSWLGNKVLKIDDIKFFSFDTVYEWKLSQKNLASANTPQTRRGCDCFSKNAGVMLPQSRDGDSACTKERNG